MTNRALSPGSLALGLLVAHLGACRGTGAAGADGPDLGVARLAELGGPTIGGIVLGSMADLPSEFALSEALWRSDHRCWRGTDPSSITFTGVPESDVDSFRIEYFLPGAQPVRDGGEQEQAAPERMRVMGVLAEPSFRVGLAEAEERHGFALAEPRVR